jgi:cytochrome c oxidase assembly factor CtaG
VIAEPVGSDLLYAWSAEPGIVMPLAVAALLYLRGASELWRHAGPSRGLRRWQAVAFAAGWLVLALALLSPLHELSEALFSAHMVQHELLMVIAAPLIVLGRPLVAFAWSLPKRWRHGLAGWTGTAPARVAGALGRPAVAWLLHAVAIWAWHAPGLYDAALRSAPLHALQHASFLGTALLFWWALIHTARRRYGVSVLYLFTTAVHTTALGAVLALATRPLYPAYAGTSAWGLSALEDQQLAGLIMWVPGSVVYLVAALALMLAWLRQSDRGAPAAETASRERVPLDAAVAAVRAAP